MQDPPDGSDDVLMHPSSTLTHPAPGPTAASASPPAAGDAPLRWVDPVDLERRLEAHLLIARRLRA